MRNPSLRPLVLALALAAPGAQALDPPTDCESRPPVRGSKVIPTLSLGGFFDTGGFRSLLQGTGISWEIGSNELRPKKVIKDGLDLCEWNLDLARGFWQVGASYASNVLGEGQRVAATGAFKWYQTSWLYWSVGPELAFSRSKARDSQLDSAAAVGARFEIDVLDMVALDIGALYRPWATGPLAGQRFEFVIALAVHKALWEEHIERKKGSE